MRKHEPVPEEEMNWMSPRRTICQVLREIYFNSEDENIKYWEREATGMAKAMTEKLLEGKPPKFVDEFWDKNPDFKRWLDWKKTLKGS